MVNEAGTISIVCHRAAISPLRIRQCCRRAGLFLDHCGLIEVGLQAARDLARQRRQAARVNGTMMRIVLLGKRASVRPTSGQRFGSAAAPEARQSAFAAT